MSPRVALAGFALLAAFAIAAFWPSYFAAPPFKADFGHIHFHGVAMFSWIALALAQAFLVHTGRRGLHRALGRVSFVLVPVVVASTIALAHFRLREVGPTAELRYFLYVQFALLVFFAVSWALAMASRGTPALHARFMVAAMLAMVDPIFARLIYHATGGGVGWPMGQYATFGLTVAVLLALAWRDRRSPRLAAVDLALAAAFTALLMPTFFVPQAQAWLDFTVAFSRLPLP